VLRDSEIPLAVAALDPDRIPLAVRDAATIVVAPAAHAESTDVLCLPARSVDTALHQPVTPFVRSRWRRRLGLDEDLVVDLRTPVGNDAPVATLMALASAVIATDGTVLTAMALGTPTVVENATAHRLGLAPFDDDGLRTTGAADTRPEADLLAADPTRAARMGRRARRIAERQFSTDTVAQELAKHLGLRLSSPVGLSGLVRALDELHTEPLAPQALHALDSLAPVVDTASLADVGARR